MATTVQPYRIVGPSGQRLYPSPSEFPNKYRSRPALARDPKRSISQYDHAELVTLSSTLAARIPALRGAIRDKNTWAFGDSWYPIYRGSNKAWGEQAKLWLSEQVFPNAVVRGLRQDLLWAMRVSGMAWDIHGDDLAIFTEDANHFPKLVLVPATRIGNGQQGYGWLNSVTSGTTSTAANGLGVVKGGRWDGNPIYNGVIYNWEMTPVGVRVLGVGRDGKETTADFKLGFGGGCHLAVEYEWHEQGRGLPRLAASVLQWLQKEEIDDLFLKGLKLAASKNVIHKLSPGMDAEQARNNALTTVVVPAGTTASGVEEKIFVEYAGDGDVTYIRSEEDLAGLDYENPHPNSEAFATRVLRECFNDLGWPYELLDMRAGGRAPTRLTCSIANKSIWQRQSTGWQRMLEFTRYAIAKGMKHDFLPRNDAGMDPYLWEFGLPAEMTVDEGNAIKGALDKLRMGLTTQANEAAKDGRVLSDLKAERKGEILEDIAAAQEIAAASGGKLTFDKALELIYQPGPNPQVTAQPRPAPGKPNQNQAP